ncbi:MAG: CRISPR-associated protein [Saprospiraceae bacterium]|nr:CRISPR-associated protein [Saprospiraceae bacterium]
MLLNISNHPSSRWTDQQKKTAEQQFETIEDLAFPNISPEATAGDVQILAGEFIKKINKRSPKAVHLMGEMTFTYALVSKLKKAGIKCIASTTNRIVEEKDGKKIVQFQFVQYREY